MGRPHIANMRRVLDLIVYKVPVSRKTITVLNQNLQYHSTRLKAIRSALKGRESLRQKVQ
ncbi:hypothetical protein CF597_21265 [Pseudomonas sp. PSB1]|nr:hypothetical protein [Pseudomonas sp. PSB1]